MACGKSKPMSYEMTVIVKGPLDAYAVVAAKKEHPSLSEEDAVKAYLKLLETQLEQDFPEAMVHVSVDYVP